MILDRVIYAKYCQCTQCLKTHACTWTHILERLNGKISEINHKMSIFIRMYAFLIREVCTMYAIWQFFKSLLLVLHNSACLGMCFEIMSLVVSYNNYGKMCLTT